MMNIKERITVQEPKKLLTICLMLTLATSLFMTLSPVHAQGTLTTVAFVDAVPNPVGVGEEVLIRYGVFQQLGYPEDGWTGLSVTIDKPDGTTQTLDNLRTDSTDRRISCRVYTRGSWYICINIILP